MKVSEYISDKKVIDDLYEDMDYLDMISAVQEASTPWNIRRTLSNDIIHTRLNFMLDSFDEDKVDAIQRVQQNISKLFRLAFKKYFTEELGLENCAEISIVYNEDSLELSVYTVKIIIKYSSYTDMIENVLNYDTTNLFNHKIFQFIYTMANMTEDNVWIEIKRNGMALLHTRDDLALKIKHSFCDELKYLTAKSTGIRKESLLRAIAIFNRC
jgi:hypothetical protein